MSKSRQGHQQGNHSRCPDRKLLSAMLRGELLPNVTDELAIHIDRCQACIQTLELIDDTSDSLAYDLRNVSLTDLSIVHQELLEQESYGATTMFGLMGTAKGIQARLNPPCDFGQYYVEKHAGRGGMGDVYLGFQKTLKRPTAIKLLRPNRTNSETAAERFKEEMRVVAMLDHPNLVKAYDGGEFDGRLYLAMELLDGDTLADYVKRKGPFSPQRACQICTKAARGLQHAHEAGIYHRDIKPGNIMFTREGKIKVLDLGLAFAPQDVISDGRNESISFAGTPDYMAPEQARDPKSVDARTDIYSLGCTLYFLLGGVPPFPKSRFPSVASLMNAHQMEPVPDIRLLNSDVSDELAEILNRMLCKDPIGRPQSAIEVCRLMESVYQSESTEFNTSLDEVRPAQRSTPRSKRRWSWAFSIAMATAVFLLMLYGSAVVLHLNNQGLVRLIGDTNDISIEAIAVNGDRFKLQVGPDKTIPLRADTYELRIVGRESTEVVPSQIRVSRGGMVVIDIDTLTEIHQRQDPPEPDVVTNSIGMKLKLIPAGEFMMGSPSDEAKRNSNEGPVHKVRITKPYYMGVTEVTQGQWLAVMKTKPWEIWARAKDGNDYPATTVSWDDAIDYCRKLSALEGKQYRLPTEAEWEYACRGGKSTAYSFGSDASELPTYSWFSGNRNGGEQSVGGKHANPFGLYDMYGNVMEWCQDGYDSTAYEGRSGTTNDPFVESGLNRVFRGGSIDSPAEDCRSATRYDQGPSFRFYTVGFRLSLSPSGQ